MSGKNTKFLKTSDLTKIAMFAAVISVMAQIAIPMPLGVPMTMQTFAISLAAIVLGAKKGGIATLLYVLMGAVGLPVFSEFSSGFAALLGPTGGFLLSFPLMAFVIGLGVSYYKNKFTLALFVVLGTVLNYALGVAMFCLTTQSSIAVGLAACVIPFIPTAIIKAVFAVLIGIQLRKRLGMAVKCQ